MLCPVSFIFISGDSLLAYLYTMYMIDTSKQETNRGMKMKAIVKNKESEYFGVKATVIEILHNRIAVLAISGKKIDFGMSEIELLSSFDVGRYVAWEFQKMDTSDMLRGVDIKKTAKRASIALNQKKSVLSKSLYMYV